MAVIPMTVILMTVLGGVFPPVSYALAAVLG